MLEIRYFLMLLLIGVLIFLVPVCVGIYFTVKKTAQAKPILVSLLGFEFSIIGGFLLFKYNQFFVEIFSWFVIILGLYIVFIPVILNRQR